MRSYTLPKTLGRLIPPAYCRMRSTVDLLRAIGVELRRNSPLIERDDETLFAHMCRKYDHHRVGGLS